ncbi:hypothetical protein QC762_403485 [Podospora pseudocomata]|uniref:C2H2-type domain-containing protein n=1 Tax=Podospora pseudocomata TaxID=2093779 RepID=A0ABR0GFF9_9PEZI|nr:hypothetical protein QC762_403485 [Podospora pseudocomata]
MVTQLDPLVVGEEAELGQVNNTMVCDTRGEINNNKRVQCSPTVWAATERSSSAQIFCAAPPLLVYLQLGLLLSEHLTTFFSSPCASLLSSLQLCFLLFVTLLFSHLFHNVPFFQGKTPASPAKPNKMATMFMQAGAPGGDAPSSGGGRRGNRYDPGPYYNWDDPEEEEETEYENGNIYYRCRFCQQPIKGRRTNTKRHHITCHGRDHRNRHQWAIDVGNGQGRPRKVRKPRKARAPRHVSSRSLAEQQPTSKPPNRSQAAETALPAAPPFIPAQQQHVMYATDHFKSQYPLWPLERHGAVVEVPYWVSQARGYGQGYEEEERLNEASLEEGPPSTDYNNDMSRASIPDYLVDPTLPVHESAPPRPGPSC